MKILHVLLSPRGEGTPRLALDWLAISAVHQDVLFLSGEGELREVFVSTGRWIHFNEAFTPGATKVLPISSLVKKVAEERKPDIVISWIMSLSQWILLGARRGGVRNLVAHAGNPPGDSFVGRYLFSYLTFWINRLYGARVVAVSNYILDQYRSIPLIPNDQLVMIYNCFRSDRFESKNTNPRKRQAIMVATLERHKDHRTIIEAWRVLNGRGVHIPLLLVGDGRLKSEMVSLKDQYQLDEVQFLGSRLDVPVLLAESQLFILSTTSQEGFGTVLLEAMAAGCQVIASDVPACREVLVDGRYGELVTPADPESLATAVEKAFGRSDWSAEEQVRYARTFTVERMMKSYIRIFHPEFEFNGQ